MFFTNKKINTKVIVIVAIIVIGLIFGFTGMFREVLVWLCKGFLSILSMFQ